jgi:hypothetical protein
MVAARSRIAAARSSSLMTPSPLASSLASRRLRQSSRLPRGLSSVLGLSSAVEGGSAGATGLTSIFPDLTLGAWSSPGAVLAGAPFAGDGASGLQATANTSAIAIESCFIMRSTSQGRPHLATYAIGRADRPAVRRSVGAWWQAL